MATIFKSAMSHILAGNQLKNKTEVYLMNNLSTITADPKLIRGKSMTMKRAIAVACAAVLVCGTSIGAFAYYNTPTSYLSLDINPSVELGVNPFGKVVSAMAYNNDGKTILNGYNVYGLEVKSAINTLVKSAAQNGFVAKDGSTVIAVTSETDDSSTAVNLEDAAAQGADAAVKSEGDTATIQKENVAIERRDEARKLGITPGKLNLIQKLQALDPTITVDQYKDAKVKDIMKKFIELKKQSNKNSDTSSVNEDSQTGSEKPAEAQSQLNKGKSNQKSQKKSSVGSASNSTSSEVEGNESSSSTSGIGSNSSTASAPNNQPTSHANYGQSIANSHASNSNKK
jgi:hypothetical protein